MSKWVYNGSLVAGLLLLGVGIGLMAGVGAGLAVTGALIVALTVHTAHLVSRTERA
jgi:hypothetical protein